MKSPENSINEINTNCRPNVQKRVFYAIHMYDATASSCSAQLALHTVPLL